MRIYKICFLLLFCAPHLLAQDNFTAIGVGYSTANLSQTQFSEFIVQVNNANTGLTQPFSTSDNFQGFNVFMAFQGKKTLSTLGFSHLRNEYKAEGVIPSISPNSVSYKIGSRQSAFSLQIDYFPVRILGFGGELGYTYSTFRDERKDLFFGETDQVVDKKGGLHAGVNLILQIPLGRKAFIQLQPYYLKYLYKNDMDNVAVIYLGSNNSAATKTEVTALGGHIKLGIKIQ